MVMSKPKKRAFFTIVFPFSERYYRFFCGKCGKYRRFAKLRHDFSRMRRCKKPPRERMVRGAQKDRKYLQHFL